MLTKDDLRQIEKIIEKHDKRSDIRFAKIDDRLVEHEKEFTQIDRHFKKIDKTLDKVSDDIAALTRLVRYDYGRIMSLEDRVSRIEQHLKLPSPSSA